MSATKRRTFPTILSRVATAVVLVAILWVTVKYIRGPYFLLIIGLLMSRSVWECYLILEARGGRPFRWLGMAVCWIMAWAAAGHWPLLDMAAPMLIAVFCSFVLSVWLRQTPEEMLSSWFDTLFPLILVALPLTYLIKLSHIPGERGADLLFLLFICIIFTDTAAFMIGSLIGRHPMAPRISPAKSWEGAVAGMIAGIGAALLAHVWFYYRLPIWHAVVIGLILAVAAILGDLAESVIKRAGGVKDSSNLLPGHGGCFDRIDSLLFSAPGIYYYYMTFMQGIQ
jgi:phosphatidate cytidylyltransferase